MHARPRQSLLPGQVLAQEVGDCLLVDRELANPGDKRCAIDRSPALCQPLVDIQTPIQEAHRSVCKPSGHAEEGKKQAPLP